MLPFGNLEVRTRGKTFTLILRKPGQREESTSDTCSRHK